MITVLIHLFSVSVNSSNLRLDQTHLGNTTVPHPSKKSSIDTFSSIEYRIAKKKYPKFLVNNIFIIFTFGKNQLKIHDHFTL